MLGMSEMLRKNKEEMRKQNELERLESYKRKLAFEKNEQLKQKVVIVLVMILVIVIFFVLNSITSKAMNDCIDKNGIDYCERKLG